MKWRGFYSKKSWGRCDEEDKHASRKKLVRLAAAKLKGDRGQIKEDREANVMEEEWLNRRRKQY